MVHILPNAVDEDDKDEEDLENEPPTSVSTEVEPLVMQEDLTNLSFQRSSRPGPPTYELAVGKGSNIDVIFGGDRALKLVMRVSKTR